MAREVRVIGGTAPCTFGGSSRRLTRSNSEPVISLQHLARFTIVHAIAMAPIG
jgi:hypothetical protein